MYTCRWTVFINTQTHTYSRVYMQMNGRYYTQYIIAFTKPYHTISSDQCLLFGFCLSQHKKKLHCPKIPSNFKPFLLFLILQTYHITYIFTVILESFIHFDAYEDASKEWHRPGVRSVQISKEEVHPSMPSCPLLPC